MENFELAITILLVVLVMICVYIATSWTMWRTQKTKPDYVDEWLDKESSSLRKGLIPGSEDGLPKITITSVQPRPDIVSSEVSAPATDTEVEEDIREIDLGRLYFALQYDHTRSVLYVRLIRGEDIPMERDISATYVGVRLLPVQLQGEQVQPYETSINVSFQECYEFHIPESELAHQTLDFHICRYDRFSRKVAIGDVYLALAELGAQGIDISKEVYLCRNLIHSKEAYHPDENIDPGKQKDPASKLTKSRPAKAVSLWKIVQAAVLKGKFRGISSSFGGQDSPFYWESMFSSGNEGENVESSPVRAPSMLYKPASPPENDKKVEDEEDDEINIDEVVLKGERSGSFLFPTKSDDEDEAEEGSTEKSSAPLQISPAPEEYYRLVPFTPYTPASPFKKPKDTNVPVVATSTNKNTKDPNVSWHVPESFTSKGPDVVQALSDTYTDPRIVTSATLRPSLETTKPSENKQWQPLAAYSPKEDNLDKIPFKKRKREEANKLTSPPKVTRKVVRSTRWHKRKRTEEEASVIGPRYRRTKKKLSKLRHKKTPLLSSSSDEELEKQPKKKENRRPCRKSPQEKRKTLSEGQTLGSKEFVFEAKDFIGDCSYPLKNRAQSAPGDMCQGRSQRLRTRSSVSMSDVKDCHFDSSDLLSD